MKRLIVLFVLVTAPLLQAAELVGKHGVEILAVDGKKVQQSLFSKAELDFSEGKHQIVVMYNRRFHNSDAVTSKPHIFNIEIIGKTEVSVKPYNNPYRAQKAVNNGIEWIISNSQGTTVVTNSDPISREGLFPNSDVEGLIADYNSNNGIETASEAIVSTTASNTSTTPPSQPTVAAKTITAPVASTSLVAASSVSKQPVSTPSTTKISNTDILIHTYMKANKQEQKAFRMWLLEQDMK